MKATTDWRGLLSNQSGFALWLDSGPAERIGGRLQRKEVARVGDWLHPGTGQKIVFSRQDLVEIADSTNAYIVALGGRLRGPRIHDGKWITGKQPKADDNLAHWLSFYVEDDKLYGVVEPGDAEVDKMLGGRIRGVSLCLVPEEKDSHGNSFKNVLEHVAFTPDPVIEGQENFIRMSKTGDAADARIPVLRLPPQKEIESMSVLKTIAMSMGIAADGKDDKALEAEILVATKAAEKEKADAIAASKTAGADAVALATRVKTLELDVAARDKADLDGAVAEVKALAASASKPGAFAADREAKVRALWPKDREAAKEMLAMSREAIGAPAALPGAQVVKPQVDKGATALARKDRVDSAIALARGNGWTARTEGDGDAMKAYAIPPGGKKADEVTLVG